MYGLGASQSPNISFASSFETEPAMITSSPCFQFTGVATRGRAGSCSEAITRRTSAAVRCALRLALRHVPKAVRAYGREVLRMREKLRRRLAEPLVKADRPLGRVGVEIRRGVTYL